MHPHNPHAPYHLATQPGSKRPSHYAAHYPCCTDCAAHVLPACRPPYGRPRCHYVPHRGGLAHLCWPPQRTLVAGATAASCKPLNRRTCTNAARSRRYSLGKRAGKRAGEQAGLVRLQVCGCGVRLRGRGRGLQLT